MKCMPSKHKIWLCSMLRWLWWFALPTCSAVDKVMMLDPAPAMTKLLDWIWVWTQYSGLCSKFLYQPACVHHPATAITGVIAVAATTAGSKTRLGIVLSKPF